MNPDILGRGPTRALCAVLRVYEREGRATVRAVQQEAGYASVSSLWKQLDVLRDAGLIAFENSLHATLRPLVRPVPFGEAA